jgi:hypothetical protein
MTRGSRLIGWNAVALMAVVVAACGGSGERVAPATTSLRGTTATTAGPGPSTTPPTTATPATTAPPTTTPASAPTTAPIDDGAAGFVPACVDRIWSGAAPDPLDLPADLEPLGAEPSLVIDLPRFRDREGAEPEDVVAGVTVVPGGIMVLVWQDPYGTGALGWQLVFVDHDGSVRWRRCGTGEYVNTLGAPDDPAGRVLVWTSRPDGERGVRALDVASGGDVDAADVDLPDGWPLADSGRFVLLGRTDGVRIDLAIDRLTLLDVTEGSATEVPYPDRAGGQEPFNLIWELTASRDGAGPAIVQRDPFGAAVGVYVEGAWSTDPAGIADVVGLSVREAYGDEPGVEAIAPDGSQRWFHPTEGGLPGEGFHWMVAGDTVLANVCREVDATSGCATGEFVALELATGDVRWSLPGFRSVGVAGDGDAIVGDSWVAAGARPYRLLDLATGEPVPGQEWPSHAFDNGCCGELEFVHVGTATGIVWAVDYDTISIYYPAPGARSTVRVDLSR